MNLNSAASSPTPASSPPSATRSIAPTRSSNCSNHMPSPESYRQALERMREEDQAHRKAFREIASWRSGDKKGVAKAKKALELFRYESQVLQERYNRSLEEALLWRSRAIDEVIVVLSIDVPSYRSGYRKEDY